VKEVLAASAWREDDEARILERIGAGEATLDIYGWR
jgi:hypothetical protein